MGAAAGPAVPVAGLSGLAAAGFTLILVLAMFGVGPARLSQTSLWELLTSKRMLYLLISLAIFTLSFRFLARLQARCQALVARINGQQGLSFDAGHLLGYPAPAFLVFDSRNCKIAACDVVNDAYKPCDHCGWQQVFHLGKQMCRHGQMPRRGFDDLPGKPGVLRLERSNGGFVFPLAPKPPASVLPTSRSGCVARNR